LILIKRVHMNLYYVNIQCRLVLLCKLLWKLLLYFGQIISMCIILCIQTHATYNMSSFQESFLRVLHTQPRFYLFNISFPAVSSSLYTSLHLIGGVGSNKNMLVYKVWSGKKWVYVYGLLLLVLQTRYLSFICSMPFLL